VEIVGPIHREKTTTLILAGFTLHIDDIVYHGGDLINWKGFQIPVRSRRGNGNRLGRKLAFQYRQEAEIRSAIALLADYNAVDFNIGCLWLNMKY